MAKKISSIIVYLIAFFLVSAAISQEMPVPIELQYSLFTKILTFERNFMKKDNNRIVIGIVYQSRYPASRNTKDEFMELIRNISDNTIQDRTVNFIEIDVMNDDIEKIAESEEIDVLYLTPVRAYDINTIVELCRKHKILSFSGVPGYCAEGLAVCIGQQGNKPKIFINLEASRSEGADFSSQLLKLATII